MKFGVGQFIFFVSGVVLLSLGAGLAGGRLAAQKQMRSAEERAKETAVSPMEPRAADRWPAKSADSGQGIVSGDASSAPARAVADNRASTVSKENGAAEKTVKTPAKKLPRPSGLKYMIQAISTSSQTDASDARGKLMTSGFPAGIFEANLGERGRWYRVYVGPYDTEEDARAALEDVRRIPGFDASFVKSLD